jgi:hypothetical protein
VTRHLIRRELRLRLSLALAGTIAVASIAFCAIEHLTEVWH